MRTTGQVYWFFGLSGSGKTTLSCAVAERLRAAGKCVLVIDGDEVRQGLCCDLSFTDGDRCKNVRRVSHVSKLAASQGIIVLVALITPTELMREMAAEIIGEELFSDIFVDASIGHCRKNDVKGLYALADNGKVGNFTGVSSAFERPKAVDFVVLPELETIEESVDRVLAWMDE